MQQRQYQSALKKFFHHVDATFESRYQGIEALSDFSDKELQDLMVLAKVSTLETADALFSLALKESQTRLEEKTGCPLP